MSTHFSYSELETARMCPHKWHLQYGEGWRAPAKGALDLGQKWHELLATHYSALMDTGGSGRALHRLAHIRELVYDKLQELCYGHAEDEPGIDPQRADEQYELLQWMYEGYAEAYGTDDGWQILEVEYRNTVPVFDTGLSLTFVADLVVLDRQLGTKWCVDHKSSSKTPKLRDFDLNDQFPLYAWGLSQVGIDVQGSIRSQALTRKNKVKAQAVEDRYARYRLHHTEAEQLGALADAVRDIQNMRSWAPGEHPRHLDMDNCSFRCSFREACLIGRKAGPAAEQQVLLGSGLRRRDRS